MSRRAKKYKVIEKTKHSKGKATIATAKFSPKILQIHTTEERAHAIKMQNVVREDLLDRL